VFLNVLLILCIVFIYLEQSITPEVMKS